MRKLILIKYAPEIFLKGLNRNKFEKKLKNNISNVLYNVDYKFIDDTGRWFIYSENIEEVISKVKNVFGVAELCVVSEIEADIDEIKEQALLETKESGCSTFKIVTKRANKKFPVKSNDISIDVGAYVLKNLEDIKVDIHNPECIVNVEIRDRVYLYSKRIKAVGGLPYGINGRTMLMLSGGIDSPVAGYMMARRGVELSCVYYHSHPYTSERAKEKVKSLANILKGYTGNIRFM